MSAKYVVVWHFACFTVPTLFADELAGGVAHRRGFAKSIGSNDVGVGSYSLVFPTTPVDGKSIEDCYFNCFIANGSPSTQCGNGSGTIAAVKSASPPFRVTNLRITQAGSCTGTPASLPVTLQPGQWFVQDFEFAPTRAGSFQDTHIYDMNGGNFTWFLSGSTPAAPPKIVSFTVTPPTIAAGKTATLAWSVENASSVFIDNGIGSQSPTGSATVKPSATTTYTLTATGTSTASATATVTVLTGPIVNVTSIPSAMLQQAGSGGGSSSYALTNSGGASTTITLSQDKSFFTQSPSSFTLAAGATQIITIQGTPQSAGAYEGVAIPNGNGVPSGLQVPVKLLSAAPPSGTVNAQPPSPRVDVAAPPGTSPAGSVSFTNSGNATLTGILSSDVPWIVPQTGVVTIAPGATATFTFAIDRSKRPDSSALIGSVEGNVILSFLNGPGSAFAAKTPLDNTGTPSVSIVKVVDTAQPVLTTAGIPALTAGEVALFVAGAGHVTGTNATTVFVSDINILNPLGTRAIDDVKMYYTPLSGATASSRTTSLPAVPGQVSIAVADVVKNIFNGTNEVGTVQIRSKDADKLAVSATVLTPNNAAGMFGNTIPILRSDRATDTGNALIITGLRKDATTHTNLYIQEVSGSAATVRTDFLAADGTTVGTRTDPIDAFKLLQLVNVVPATAVAATVTNTSTAGGKIAAYATPVDEVSSDTWALADWSTQLGYQPTEATIVPIAGSVHGANGTFYRTDIAITNRGASTATGTLRYTSRSGSNVDRAITLAAKQTTVLNDVVGTIMNVSGDTTGYLRFTPSAGAFAITSRTFTTAGSGAATFGTGVPLIAASSALRAGNTRPIAGLADASRSTVLAKVAGTFRTNFALMETSGNPALVRVTFRFTFPAGQKAQGIGAASRDYALNANQFLLLNSIAGEILGAARLQFADLSNVEADFQVLSGSGSVILFTSSVDNANGDSVLRTE